jgi:hypothetical protein
MAGKKQKRDGGAPVSLADALTATRAARRRVLALAERLEETERTILAAMAPAPVVPVATTTPAKRPVGRHSGGKAPRRKAEDSHRHRVHAREPKHDRTQTGWPSRERLNRIQTA